MHQTLNCPYEPKEIHFDSGYLSIFNLEIDVIKKIHVLPAASQLYVLESLRLRIMWLAVWKMTIIMVLMKDIY